MKKMNREVFIERLKNTHDIFDEITLLYNQIKDLEQDIKNNGLQNQSSNYSEIRYENKKIKPTGTDYGKLFK